MKKALDGYRLLIAEDNPTNQIVVAKMIEQMGASFDLASDGLEAIQIFDPKRHDLALLDIEMPKKSGLEVIRYIRERVDVPSDYPVIALTAFVLSEHRAKIREAGANLVIAKPITDMKNFAEELAHYLRGEVVVKNFDPKALADLRETMGDEVMPELLSSLKTDLDKIREEFEQIAKKPARQQSALASSAHALRSLAKMSGGVGLESELARLEGEMMSFDDKEIKSTAIALITSVDELLENIEAV